MQRDIDRILIPQRQIAARVAELAGLITADHSPPQAEGNGPLTIVPVLTGAMIFASDLIRQIPIAMRIGLVTVSSYPGASVSRRGRRCSPSNWVTFTVGTCCWWTTFWTAAARCGW